MHQIAEHDSPATYQLLPSLSVEDYQRLRDSIAERGVLVPIDVDENGAILDGHHRSRIAAELGIDCPRTVRGGMAEHEKRLHAVALNLDRRHLSEPQKVLLGRTIEPDVAEAARLRQVQAEGQPRGAKASVVDKCPQHTSKSRDEVARQVGLGSGRTYERSRNALEAVEKSDPDLYAKAASGEATMPEVQRKIRERKKAAKVATIKNTPAAQIPAEQTFPVILLDPPWRYDGAETPDARKIENHYPTMSLDELKMLEIPAADDAVLFCWATSPKLREALAVIEAWGFDYRTSMVWVKNKIGMGYYARQQHELILIARRGSLPVPDPQDRPSSVVNAPRGEHSAKPVAVHEAIERMYPGYRYCEMFQRQSRGGWTGWGNQA